MKRHIYKIMDLPAEEVAGRLTTYNFKPGKFWILPSPNPGVVRILYVDKEIANDE